jgi:enoyl-CoA hydratase/carnithine racemase
MVDVVLSTLEDGIRTITLNRPDSLNAMNGELIEGVCRAFAEANRDRATRVIIFTGAGRAFCAGADLKEASAAGPEDVDRSGVEILQQVTREIVFGPKIVLGAIKGWAVGGGLEWVINCDLTIWAENAKAFFPETRLGAFCTGGVTSLLPRMVGQVKARELLLFGDELSAAELLEMGVAWRVVPDDRVLPEAREVAARIMELPERTVSDLKRVLAKVSVGELETALLLETEAIMRAAIDSDRGLV